MTIIYVNSLIRRRFSHTKNPFHFRFAEEETAAANDLKLIKGLLHLLEKSMGKDEVDAYRQASPAPR